MSTFYENVDKKTLTSINFKEKNIFIMNNDTMTNDCEFCRRYFSLMEECIKRSILLNEWCILKQYLIYQV